jgi:peptide/nickel transport system substrate-binding protein
VAVAAVAVSTVLVLTGCSGGSSKASSSAAKGIVVAAPGLPTSLAFDAANPAGYENLEFFWNTQAGLIQNPYVKAGTSLLDQNVYKYQGVLAKSYTVSPDKLTYTFHLRTDVVSVAGNPLTAEDVVWSWQRKFKAATAITSFVQKPVISDPDTQIKAIDTHTVSFTVTKPGYGFTLLSMLANDTSSVYDATLLKKHATKSDPYAVTWTQTHPNFGFGAYSVKTYQPGQTLVLQANPHYALGKPAIPTITYRVVSDPGTRANALKSGDVQVAEQILPSDMATLDANKSAITPSYKLTNLFTMLTPVVNKAPFNNELVRQAMAYAIPYQQIIKNVYKSRALKTTSFIRPDAPGYSDSGLPDYTYDPAKAKALLAKAGDPNGVSFTLTLSNEVPDLAEVATNIQNYAAKAGFTVKIQVQPAATFGETESNHTAQAILWRDYATAQSPLYELSLFFQPGSPTNFSGWSSTAYSATLDKGTAIANPFTAQAGTIWNSAEQQMLTAAPTDFIARVQPLNAFSKSTTGIANRSDNIVDFSVLNEK